MLQIRQRTHGYWKKFLVLVIAPAAAIEGDHRTDVNQALVVGAGVVCAAHAAENIRPLWCWTSKHLKASN